MLSCFLLVRSRLAGCRGMADLKRIVATSEEILNQIGKVKDEISLLEKLIRERYTGGEECAESLEKENEALQRQVESYKQELVNLEIANGIAQITQPYTPSDIKEDKPEQAPHPAPAKPPITTSDQPQPQPPKSEKKKEKSEKKVDDKGSNTSGGGEPSVDVSRLDMRVGKIIDIKKHPGADSLYIEQVDIGQEKPLTVVSGLVKHVSVDEMNGRLVILLCNMKPAKMRGITSEAMVMCANTPERVEVLSPPSGCVPGDLVHVEGYPRTPDAQLNPKKKVFETVAPDLKTNNKKEATYKGAVWTVPNKGSVTTATLQFANIK